MDRNSVRKYNQIEAEKDFLEKKLLMTMIKVISDWIFEEVYFNDGESVDININSFEQKVALQGTMLEDSLHKTDKIIDNLIKSFKELDDQEKKLDNDLSTENKSQVISIATKIKDIRIKKETILRTMARNHIANPLSLLNNQLYTVALFDKFLTTNSQLKEEDDLYHRILCDSDEFSYNSQQK